MSAGRLELLRGPEALNGIYPCCSRWNCESCCDCWGIYGGYRWSFNKGYRAAKDKILENHYRQQYRKIYAPLRSLFLDIQITSSSSMRFPYLSQRLKRAFRLARLGKFKKSTAAIVDRGISAPSAEIEFGGGFPLGQIKKTLISHPSLANPEIMDLYQLVDRAQYESQMRGRSYERELLPEEFELFLHTVRRYEQLIKRFA